MVIYLPGEQREPQPAPEPSFDELTPREIVVELDKYIVGQAAAKRAEQSAEERVLDLLLPSTPPTAMEPAGPASLESHRREAADRTREKLRAQLRDGKLDQRLVEVEVRERSMPAFEIISNQGVE